MDDETFRKRFVLEFRRPFQTVISSQGKGYEIMKPLRDQYLPKDPFNHNHQARDPSKVEGSTKSDCASNQSRRENTPHFRFSACHSVSSPSSASSHAASIPPLPRYRSQENIVMSPLYPKVFQKQNHTSGGNIISLNTMVPCQERACKSNITSNDGRYHETSNLKFRENDEGRTRNPCIRSMSDSQDNGYIPRNELRRFIKLNSVDPSQRRRASIITIHMNQTQNLDSKTNISDQYVKTSDVQSNLSCRNVNSFCNEKPNTHVSNNCIPHPAACIPHNIRNKTIRNDDERPFGKFQTKFRSSIDLSFSSQGNDQHPEFIKDSHGENTRKKLLIFENSQLPEPPLQSVLDRNLFNIYAIKIKSIATPSDESSRIKSGFQGPKALRKVKSTASITLVYKDFDEMIAKMLEAKDLVNSKNPGLLSDAQLYFTGQLDSKDYIPAINVNQLHSDESRKRACDHLVNVILKYRIDKFNRKYPQHVLNMPLNSDIFEGSIQVHVNLIRPFELDELSSKELLPRNTIKIQRITSETSTREVIGKILLKLNVNENPRKLALYHKHTSQRGKGRLRRLDPDEFPLRMYLEWAEKDKDWHLKNSFLLQENDTGDVKWELFSQPELQNFLRMLNEEEMKFTEEIKLIYRTIQRVMKDRIHELESLGCGKDDDVIGDDDDDNVIGDDDGDDVIGDDDGDDVIGDDDGDDVC